VQYEETGMAVKETTGSGKKLPGWMVANMHFAHKMNILIIKMI